MRYKQYFRNACEIELENKLVITGGIDGSTKGVKTVAEYSLGTRFISNETMKYLMDLKTGRERHACSQFVNEGGVMVKLIDYNL